MTLQELREKRGNLMSEIDAIEATAKKDERELTDEEVSDIEAKLAEVEAIGGEQAKAERRSSITARLSDARIQGQTSPGPRTIETPEDSEKRIGRIHDRGLDDPTGGFNSFGEMALAVRDACIPGGAETERLRFLSAQAGGLTRTEGPAMGWAIPVTQVTEIWDGIREDTNSLLMQTDLFENMTGPIELLANAETSRATGSRYGGVRGYWFNEAENITVSKPKVRKLRLDPQGLGVLIPVTNQLLATGAGPIVTQYLNRASTEELSFLIGDAIINGTGAGMPLGLMNSDSLVTISKETDQAATTLVKRNFDNMFARMPARALAGAAWYVNVDTFPSIFNLSQDVGTGGSAMFIAPGQMASAPAGAIYGKPIVPIEYCQTVGTAGDVIFANLNYYAAGMIGALDAQTSIHLWFDSNQTAFRFVVMVDGQPWLESALTPFKGANDLSTHVVVEART